MFFVGCECGRDGCDQCVYNACWQAYAEADTLRDAGTYCVQTAESVRLGAHRSLLQTVQRALEHFFAKSGAPQVAESVGYTVCLTADCKRAAVAYLPILMQSASPTVMCHGETKDGYLITAFKE